MLTLAREDCLVLPDEPSAADNQEQGEDMIALLRLCALLLAAAACCPDRARGRRAAGPRRRRPGREGGAQRADRGRQEGRAGQLLGHDLPARDQ